MPDTKPPFTPFNPVVYTGEQNALRTALVTGERPDILQALRAPGLTAAQFGQVFDGYVNGRKYQPGVKDIVAELLQPKQNDLDPLEWKRASDYRGEYIRVNRQMFLLEDLTIFAPEHLRQDLRREEMEKNDFLFRGTCKNYVKTGGKPEALARVLADFDEMPLGDFGKRALIEPAQRQPEVMARAEWLRAFIKEDGELSVAYNTWLDINKRRNSAMVGLTEALVLDSHIALKDGTRLDLLKEVMQDRDMTRENVISTLSAYMQGAGDRRDARKIARVLDLYDGNLEHSSNSLTLLQITLDARTASPEVFGMLAARKDMSPEKLSYADAIIDQMDIHREIFRKILRDAQLAKAMDGLADDSKQRIVTALDGNHDRKVEWHELDANGDGALDKNERARVSRALGDEKLSATLLDAIARQGIAVVQDIAPPVVPAGSGNARKR